MHAAAAKDTIKISAPVTKSNASTAMKTTNHSQETVQYSKKKWKSSGSKQRNAYPDNRPYENFSYSTHILNKSTHTQ